MKDKQLGRTKYIRLGVIKLPAGIFLGMTGQAAATVSVSEARRFLAKKWLHLFPIISLIRPFLSAVKNVGREIGDSGEISFGLMAGYFQLHFMCPI